MRGLLLQAEDLLRTGTPPLHAPLYPSPALAASPPVTARRPASPAILLTMILLFGLTYGAAMGTYSGGLRLRAWQMLYSGLKVPFLLLATFALSIPSFFVLNSLLGLRQDFSLALRALLSTQAGLTIILCALAPFTLFWYAGNNDYQSAVLFNTAMFAFASLTAQILLRRFYRPLILRDPRHRLLLQLWLLIYAFVGIQMGWLLRPFIGDPHLPTHFLRTDAWGNAYVILARTIWDVMNSWR